MRHGTTEYENESTNLLGKSSPTMINPRRTSRERLPVDQFGVELGLLAFCARKKKSCVKIFYFLNGEIKYTHIYTKDPRVDSTYDPGKNQQRKPGKELINRSTLNN